MFTENLNDCLLSLVKKSKRIILGGDFNVIFNVPSARVQLLEDMLRSFGLYVTSFTPTRGSACLDTIATNLDNCDYEVAVVSVVIADHFPVQMIVKSSSLVSYQKPISWHASAVRVYSRNGLSAQSD